MNGSDYVAVVRLTNKAGQVLAMPGETCERVPVTSLAQLAINGDIQKRPAPEKSARRQGKE